MSIVVDFDFSCESRIMSHINIKLYICAYVPVPTKILYIEYFAKGTKDIFPNSALSLHIYYEKKGKEPFTQCKRN